MTGLHGKTLGVRIIVAPTVHGSQNPIERHTSESPITFIKYQWLGNTHQFHLSHFNEKTSLYQIKG